MNIAMKVSVVKYISLKGLKTTNGHIVSKNTAIFKQGEQWILTYHDLPIAAGTQPEMVALGWKIDKAASAHGIMKAVERNGMKFHVPMFDERTLGRLEHMIGQSNLAKMSIIVESYQDKPETDGIPPVTHTPALDASTNGQKGAKAKRQRKQKPVAEPETLEELLGITHVMVNGEPVALEPLFA